MSLFLFILYFHISINIFLHVVPIFIPTYISTLNSIVASRISTSVLTDTKSTSPPYVCVCVGSFSPSLWYAERGSSVSGRAPHLWHITASLGFQYTQKRGFSALWIQSDLCLQMQLFDDVSKKEKVSTATAIFAPSSPQQSWNAKDEKN